VAVAIWVAGRGRGLRDDPAEVLRHLRAAGAPALPEAASAAASARSEIEQYDRETLYEFIDGAADAYLVNGFERCAAATFTFAGAAGGELEVAAEVYRFAAADGARAQLEAERPTAGNVIEGIPGAVSDGMVLLLVEGRDLLKLTALGRGADAAGELGRIAAAWQKEQPR